MFACPFVFRHGAFCLSSAADFKYLRYDNTLATCLVVPVRPVLPSASPLSTNCGTKSKVYDIQQALWHPRELAPDTNGGRECKTNTQVQKKMNYRQVLPDITPHPHRHHLRTPFLPSPSLWRNEIPRAEYLFPAEETPSPPFRTLRIHARGAKKFEKSFDHRQPRKLQKHSESRSQTPSNGLVQIFVG